MTSDYAVNLDLIAALFTAAYMARLLFVSYIPSRVKELVKFNPQKRSLMNQNVRRRLA